MRKICDKFRAALPGTLALAVIGLAGTAATSALQDWTAAARSLLGA